MACLILLIFVDIFSLQNTYICKIFIFKIGSSHFSVTLYPFVNNLSDTHSTVVTFCRNLCPLETHNDRLAIGQHTNWRAPNSIYWLVNKHMITHCRYLCPSEMHNQESEKWYCTIVPPVMLEFIPCHCEGLSPSGCQLTMQRCDRWI